MFRNISILAAIIACMTTLNSPASARYHRGAAPIQAGELIFLKASLAGVEGGTSRLLVRKVQKTGKDTYLLATMKARTNTFFDKIHKVNNIFSSWFSLFHNGAFRYHLDVDQAGLRQSRRLNFKSSKRRGTLLLAVKTYANKRGPVWRPWKRRYRVPANTHNLVSALYYARFLKYRRGKRFRFFVFVQGKIWRVSGKMTKKVKLFTAIGTRRALLVEADTWSLRRPRHKRKLRIWLSDDRFRLPLKIEGYVPRIGVAKAELTAYRRNYRSRLLNKRNQRRGRKGRAWGFLSDF